MSVQEMKIIIPTLSHQERKELLEVLVDTFTVPDSNVTSEPKRSLRELRGLGKEIWAGIDAQQYIDEQRNDWDRPK